MKRILEYSFIVGVDGKKDKERPYLNHLQSVKTCNCFRNTLIRSNRMLSRSLRNVLEFEIIGHLQQMIHDSHGFYSKSLTKYDT